jgi:DNA invertase Pin-like site-specific DNA recombinase
MEFLYEMPIGRPPGRPTTVDDPEHILRRGRALGMIEAGMKRKDVARRLGVRRETIWRWEKLDAPREPLRYR